MKLNIKQVRIGNIACNPIKDDNKYLAQFVKYNPNKYYQKENDYEWSKDKEYAIVEPHIHISKNSFKSPETCYVFAFLVDSPDCPDIVSCGLRISELSTEEYSDFKIIISIISDEFYCDDEIL